MVTEMYDFDQIVEQHTIKLRRKYNFKFKTEVFPYGSQIALYNAQSILLFSVDKRVNNVECVIGLIKDQDQPGFQYSVEKIVDFKGGDSLDFFSKIEKNSNVENQVRAYTQALEEFCHDFLNGDTEAFKLLHQFSRGYNAAYTRCMSDPVSGSRTPTGRATYLGAGLFIGAIGTTLVEQFIKTLT